MEFFTQTAFALAVIGFILSIKDRRGKRGVVLFVLSVIFLTAYIAPYLYLFFTGKLNWIKTVSLITVIFFSILSIWHYASLKWLLWSYYLFCTCDSDRPDLIDGYRYQKLLLNTDLDWKGTQPCCLECINCMD